MLEFFIISVIILLVLYFFSGKIMQFLMKKLVKKMQKQAQQQYEAQNDIRPEGELRVETPATQKTVKGKKYNFDKVGEYVKFEEVKGS
ncbi:DUF4834 family protein [Bernardetia sp.]|uniref:DUF4834 family protein n=1 Tax=Bernardetia sp. TaxID=1937974 RepID=UPI0025C540C5|nr:DUF4834 family protein [Bernardetia sp.]